MYKDTFINIQTAKFPNVSKDILEFIANIVSQEGFGPNAAIINLFSNGYCYYFALMLKDAFGGELYADIDKQHILWKDTREGNSYGLFYDIHGAHKCKKQYMPIELLYDSLECYRHRGKDHELFIEIEEYKEIHNITSGELNEKVFGIIPDNMKSYPYPNEEDTLRYFKQWLFSLK